MKNIFRTLLFFSLTFGQTYEVGDVVDNFSAPICQNGEGYWEYDVDGRNKVVWINLFTSW